MKGIRKDYPFGQKFYIKGCKPKYQPKKKITYELSFLLFPVLSSRSFPLGAPVFPLLENLSYNLASQAGVFRGAPYFVPPHFLGRGERRAPLKTPAWEVTYNRSKKSVSKQAT